VEELKKITEITRPDARSEMFVVENKATGQHRPVTLPDLHKSAQGVELHGGVPESIRGHFAVAQNLLLYSWFFYPFNVTAQFMALVTVEFALKERLKPKGRVGFKKLIEMAVSQGLIRDEGFSHICGQPTAVHHLKSGSDVASSHTDTYATTLATIMPYLRNELAHGSKSLGWDGAMILRVCAEFINQLFP